MITLFNSEKYCLCLITYIRPQSFQTCQFCETKPVKVDFAPKFSITNSEKNLYIFYLSVSVNNCKCLTCKDKLFYYFLSPVIFFSETFVDSCGTWYSHEKWREYKNMGLRLYNSVSSAMGLGPASSCLESNLASLKLTPSNLKWTPACLN